MHILFAVHGYKPAYRFGGPIWSVSAIAEELAARGHRVSVFTTNSNLDQTLDVPVDQPIEVNGVTVWYFHVLDIQRKFFWWSKYVSQSMGFLYTPALKAALRRILPTVDVVHTQMPYIYPTMITGKEAIKLGKPLFYHQRGVFHPERLKYRGLKKRIYISLIEKPIMRKATALIALTQDEVVSFRRLGINTPCHIVPNGVDVRNFRLMPRSDSDLKIEISAEAKVILFLGRLHPTKGVDVLVEAFFQIAAIHPEAWLILAGPDEHAAASQLKEQVKQKGLSERVILTGMVLDEQKADLLARADVFVLPSTGEGQSMAIMEALASGTPVVISPECNFSVVEEMGAGKVVRREPASVARAISYYLSDPARALKASESAYTFAREKLSWKSVVDTLEEIYRSGGQNGSNASPR
jgi:glycosyltransferase involved in cell wall biosynthesis